MLPQAQLEGQHWERCPGRGGKGAMVGWARGSAPSAATKQTPTGLLVSLRIVVEENGARRPGQQSLIFLLCLFPELFPDVLHAAPGHSGPTPGAMWGGMSSCTYLQPHECKTRERAL